MSFPHWPITINLVVQGYRSSDDVTMQLRRLLPFPPVPGLKLELWREEPGLKLELRREEREGDDDFPTTYPIPLEDLTYSFEHSSYIAYVEDTDAVREGAEYQRELVAFYKTFGFTVTSPPPTAQAIRKEA